MGARGQDRVVPEYRMEFERPTDVPEETVYADWLSNTAKRKKIQGYGQQDQDRANGTGGLRLGPRYGTLFVDDEAHRLAQASDQDQGLADQRLRLLHQYAYPGSAQGGGDGTAHLSAG